MRVRYYRHARCELFRLPPVQVTEVRRIVEDKLLEAWQRGASASDAIEQVLSDQGVTGTLAYGIVPNLEFQKHRALDRIGEERRRREEQYERERAEELARIEEASRPQLQQTRAELETIAASEGQRRRAYSASAARLAEMRERFHRKVERFGGEEGYRALQEISEEVAAAAAQEKTAQERQAVAGEGNIRPAVQTLEETVRDATPGPGKLKRFVRKIYDILPYELW